MDATGQYGRNGRIWVQRMVCCGAGEALQGFEVFTHVRVAANRAARRHICRATCVALQHLLFQKAQADPPLEYAQACLQAGNVPLAHCGGQAAAWDDQGRDQGCAVCVFVWGGVGWGAPIVRRGLGWARRGAGRTVHRCTCIAVVCPTPRTVFAGV